MTMEIATKLIRQFRDGKTGSLPQYAMFEPLFKLGRMKKNWSKSGITYIKKGEFVLYQESRPNSDRPHSIYGPSFFYERFNMTLGDELFASNGTHIEHISDIDHDALSFPYEDLERWERLRAEKRAMVEANIAKSKG